MRCISAALALVAFVAGLAAAWFWYKSSRVLIVPTWAIDDGSEPVIPELSQGGWISGLLTAGTEAARLNKIAARLTAASVALGTIASVAGAWPVWPCSN